MPGRSGGRHESGARTQNAVGHDTLLPFYAGEYKSQGTNWGQTAELPPKSLRLGGVVVEAAGSSSEVWSVCVRHRAEVDDNHSGASWRFFPQNF